MCVTGTTFIAVVVMLTQHVLAHLFVSVKKYLMVVILAPAICMA